MVPSIHIHLLLEGFRILDRNGKAPFDLIHRQHPFAYIGKNESRRVIMRFVPFRGKFVMHSLPQRFS